jgi:hypothetical protein
MLHMVCHQLVGACCCALPTVKVLSIRLQANNRPWGCISEYVVLGGCVLAEANGLQDIKTADWSNEVAPFWGEVVKSALTSEGMMGLLKAGWTTIKGRGCSRPCPVLCCSRLRFDEGLSHQGNKGLAEHTIRLLCWL